MLVHRAGHRGAEGAADEDAGHVQRVQTATTFRVQRVHRALAEDHVHLHAEVQHHAGHGQADDAIGRVDEGGEKAQAGGYVSRAGLRGKTLRMVLALTEEEQPAVQDNWVKVVGGWKRCRGESQEDIFAFCRGNVSDFKAFKMPDGRLCNIYPTCD